MALPKAVEEQARQAEELLKKMQGKPEEGNTEESAPDESGESSNADNGEGAGLENKNVDTKEQPDTGADTVPKSEYEELKSKYDAIVKEVGSQPYKVLQGKYNAEVPRLHERIRELEATKPAKADEGTIDTKKATPEDLGGVLKILSEEYGESFAGNVHKLIRDEINSAMAGVKVEVEGVKSTVAATREEKFLRELTELVPTWQETFNNPEFSNYLDNVDPMSGMTLRELALDANRKHDAKRLARFYKAFDESQGKGETKESLPKEKDKREALITPATSGKQNTSVGGEKPDYIRSTEVTQFYRDVTRGYYTYRPKEQKAMEDRINRAISKGWVIE